MDALVIVGIVVVVAYGLFTSENQGRGNRITLNDE